MDVEWRAYLLHPETPAEGQQLPDAIQRRMASTLDALRRRARASGREMVAPPIISNTRRAHEAAFFARDTGRHEAFHQAVFHAYYGEGKDIGRWDVLEEAAREAGLDPDVMRRAVEAGTYHDAVEAELESARELGITGVPTFIFDDRLAVVGAQPFEVFRQAMAELERDDGEYDAST